MDGVVGRGTVLAGRYQLAEPRPADLPGTSAWAATDQILVRPVVVRIFPAAGSGPALDAARRAALVTDPRLVRVLDVGSDQGVGYVVTEQVSGPTLAQLVAREALSADQARSIVGEAASALEVARRRGVHHLALRPAAVAVSDDGRVLVSGLALDATLLTRPGGDARTTSRTDAADLVRLVYTALTGHWPGPLATSGGLPTAPESDGAPVPPAELVPGVPADLNTLCVATLGRADDGPVSPADVVRELEPWGEIRVQPRPRLAVPPPAPAPTTGPGQVVRQSVRSAFAEPPVSAHRPGTPPAARQRHGGAAGLGGAALGAGAVAAGAGPAAPGPVAGWAPDQAAAAPFGGDDTVTPALGVPTGPVQGLPPAPAPGGPFRPGPPPGAVASPPAGPSRVMPPPGPLGAGPGAPAAMPGAAASLPPEADPFDFGGVDDRPPRRIGTAIAVGLVGLLVVVAIAFAAKALFTGRGSSTHPGVAATASQHPSGSTSPAPSSAAPSPSPSATPTVRAGATPVISGITSIDPSDPAGEHPEAVGKAFDGNPTTFWYSRTYKRNDFAGLKPAVGLALTLTERATVTTVTLHVNGTGGNVEVRATDASAPTQGAVLASGPMSPDTVLTLSPAPTTSSLVLWFTQLPTTADGSFRVELTEIQLG